MKYRIINHGNTRKLPYKGKYYFLKKKGGFETENKGVAEALSSYPYIEARKIENFEGKTIQQLRKIASKKGISWIGLKKVDLLNKLNE